MYICTHTCIYMYKTHIHMCVYIYIYILRHKKEQHLAICNNKDGIKQTEKDSYCMSSRLCGI